MKKITLLFFMSLMSFCAFAQLPLEGFEGTWPPAGWEIYNNGIGPAVTWAQSQAGNITQPPYAGTHAAYLNRENVATGIPEDWLVTPTFPVPANPQLRFFSRLTQPLDDGSIYRVLITTNTANAGVFADYTLLEEWTELEINPVQTVYNEVVVPIPASFVGQNVRIAFVMAGDNGDRWLVDNVSVVSQCIDPSNLGANSFGLTTANLTWTNNSGATSWEIEILPAAAIPTEVGVVYNGAPPYPATGLTQDTDYKFYVRALCADGGTSEWVGPFFFSTVALGATCNAPIEIATLPYSTTNNTSNFGDDYSGSPGASGCGSTSAYLNGDDVVYSYTATANGTINIAMTGNGAWSGMFVYTSCANIGVNCAAGGVGGSAGNPVTIPNFAVTAGQTYYIVISTFAAPQSTPYTLTIQQVFCAPPVGNPTTGITTTTANLSWTNPSGATSWEVAIQPVGTGVPTGAGTTVSSNTYTATSLTPSTQYEYYVRAACGDGNFSIWAGPYTFNTLCDSFGVPFTEGFNSTSPTQQCWTVLNLNGDTDVWNMDYALNAFEGNQSAAITTDFNAGNNNDWLISPTINLTGNQRLKFHQRVQSAGEPNDFRVVASTTGIDPASFTITLMPLASYNNTTYVEYIVNIVDATNTPVSGPVNIAWHVPNGGLDGWRLYIDNVIIEDIPTCPDPTALTATSITANSAQLGWTPGFNETSWEVVVQAPGTGVPTGAGTAVTGGTPTYAATGLTSNTQYEYYVRATCAANDNSNWVGPFTFTTACDPLPIPFFEGFNSDSATQNCWTVLNLNGDADAWNMDYALNAFEGNQSAAITTDFNAGNNNDWLISPTLILTGNQRLKFHQRVQSTGEPNDFRVVLSTTGTNPADFTTTLIPLASYNNTTYVEYIVNIVDATNTPISGPVNIAWHVPNGGLDGWRLYVDNVIVEDIPTCPDPTALTAGNFTPNTADLSWTPGFTETSWEIVVQAPGTGEPTGAGTPVTVDPEYTATGLTANTTYEYYVRATCAADDLSNWVGPFTFTTACDAFTVPFFEGFNAGSTTQPCWTVLNLNGDTDAWNMDYAVTPFEGNQSAAITTDFNNGNNNDWLISPQIILTGNQRLKFHQRVQSVNEPDQFEVLVSTTGTNPADFTTVLLPLATYSNITYQEFIINLFDGATPISGPVYIAWHIPSGGPDGWRLYVDNVIVEDIPTCPDPTNLVVVDATDTTVDLSWTAGLNETQWEVIVQPQGTGEPADTATGVIADSNTFTVTGLTPGEEYEVYIRAVCAVDDLSNWVGPVNFNTDVCAPADQCIYDFVMVDSFGDSWNGNTMSIIQNGITVATLTGPTNADDTNPVTVSVGLCTGIPFELFWNAGGSFAGEVGISVINTTYSETVYEKEPGQGSQNSLLYTGIPVCSPITCPQPTDLLSEGVNLESVQLSWVPGGAETQWEVVVQLQGDPYPGDTPADTAIVNGDPEYLAEGLTPSVFYEYYVRAICGPGDVSFWSGPYQFSIFAPPGCAGVDVYDDELEVVAPGSELTICPGEETCVDLSANYFEIGETTEYTVESIDYAPPFPFLGGQELNVNTDDIWSPVVNLPFEFCFYGETYDEAKVGSNGVVMFGDNMTNGGNCPWSYDESVPDPGFPILNAIYGVYQDINPAVAGSDVSINYQVLGSYPCRALVVNYYDVPQFSCGLSVGTQTTQIVIYEVSNIIEVYVESRTPCTGWNGGRGVIGLQNADGTEGITPPDRNTGAWTATEEAWRFLPSGDTNVVFEWLQDGDFYSNENDITVCVSGETEMTARATYTTCTGEQIIKESTFNINVAAPIEANEPQDLSLCSNGEEVTFDLTESLEGLMDDPTGYNFTFYATEEAAELGLTDNLPESYTTDTAQTIWVRITLGDSPCYITRSFELILNNVPPQFTATEDTTVCEGTPVTLEVFPGNFDGSSDDVSYSWTLDGDDLGLTTQSITVTAAGIYEVTVNNGGCVGTEQIVVTTTPTPVPDAPADVTACDSYTLPALTVGNYYTATGGQGDMLAAGDVITATQTLYVYAVSDTNPDCTAENSFVVTINNTPVLDVPADVASCDSYVLPALATGNYYTGPGATGTMLNADDVITTSQTIYVYASTGTTPDCSAEGSFVVTITDSPVAQVMADVTECDSYTLPALNPGNAYYTGTGGTGDMLAAGEAITATQTIYIFAETGTTPNCTDESSFVVTINPTPQFSLGGPYSACLAETVSISVTGANFNTANATYVWTYEGTILADNDASITPANGAFGNYEVTVTVNGCTATQSVTVTENTDALALMYEEGCEGGDYLVTVMPFNDPDTGDSFNPDTASYAWSGPNGFSGSTQQVTIPAAGIYTVTVTTADGCVGEVEVNVLDTSCSIPRGISPNGDGMNDSFDLTSLGVSKITIFNRYGKEVFSYGAYTNQWHGQTSNGDELPTGTYFYSIQRSNGESKTGWVYINRQQ